MRNVLVELHNSTIRAIYDRMWKDARPQLQQDNLYLDPYLHAIPTDPRQGLGLFVWPCRETLAAIEQKIYASLRPRLPEQYFYPLDTIHMTYLEIISANPERYNPARIPAYEHVFTSFFSGNRSFRVTWQGMTCTRSAIVLQGYPTAPTLNEARQELRARIAAAELHRTERIPLRIAHCSIIRFKSPLDTPPALVAAIDRLRDVPIGEDLFTRLCCMQSDWYMLPSMTRTLSYYNL